jgi:signal transduction histidine kinase/streptogramin lyase
VATENVKLRRKKICGQRVSRRFFAGAALLCQFTFLAPVFALNPKQSVHQYNCQTWTRQSGLSASGINAIAQTKDGFIWLGTQKGIVRYDGAEFKILTLPQTKYFQHQAISSLSGAADGDLWFGILNGAVGLYRQDSGFVAITNQSWLTPGMNVSAITEPSDASVWVCSAAGVVRWDPQSNSVRSFDMTSGECLATFEDSHHRIWLSMLGKGVFYYDGTNMVAFPDASLADNNTFVFGITEDLEGQFWFAMQSGVRVYDRDFHRKAGPDLAPKMYRILADHEGTIWIGSDGNGLYCYRHGQLTVLQKSDGLADDHITALFEDSEGSLWIGTRGGLSLLSDIKFPMYSPEALRQKMPIDGTPAFHSVCASASGGVWTGSSIGLYRFNGDQFTYYGNPAGLESLWLKQVFEARDGDLYLGNGSHNVEIFRDGKVIARHKCSTWTTGFAEDQKSVLVGVGPELYRINRDGMTPYTFTNEAPSFGWIHSINVRRDGTILVASATGVYRIKDGGYQHFSTANGLAVDDALWVCEDQDGILWAGLAGGIARIEGEHVESWTRDNGLFDDYIREIVPDENGWLWVHSGGGIFRIHRYGFIVEGNKAEHLNCETFDSMDSVKTLETADTEYSVCRTTDGSIWIPSPQGIIKIDPAHLPGSAAAPVVHIEKIRANGRDWSCDGGPVIRPGKGDLEVEYTAPTFIAPQKLQFRYKLEGYDTDWVDAGTRRSAFYTNLKPRKYHFIVEVSNADAEAHSIPASFDVELPPRFYQTGWFYSICAATFFAAIGGVYGWRVRHLEKKQRALREAHDRLEAEVRNRTAELADLNTSLHQRTISLEKEIEQRKQMQVEIDRTHQQLLKASRQAGMAEVATSVLHNVGNVLNSINVATTVLTERLKNSKISFVSRTGQLMTDHVDNLAEFITRDPKGQQLPKYLVGLGEQLNREQSDTLQELASLEKNVTHIKEIVAAQQSYARVSGVATQIDISELIDEALRITELSRTGIKVVEKHDGSRSEIVTDRHKVLQILVNLMTNARAACLESTHAEKEVIVAVTAENGAIKISVIDNGVGIPRENLTRIFSHGFTTKKDGHGFGLHSSSLAAKELGGSLLAQSDGPNKGASFTLELPLHAANAKLAEH